MTDEPSRTSEIFAKPTGWIRRPELDQFGATAWELPSGTIMFYHSHDNLMALAEKFLAKIFLNPGAKK